MFWADQIVDDFLAGHGESANKRKLILRDEKTISGRPHVGSLRSFVMHAVISDVLNERKVDNVFFYELNDTDAFDSVPAYVPADWDQHLGKRLKDVPSPDGKAENYAMYFAQEYKKALINSKFNATFYVGSHKYEAGEYDRYIANALNQKDKIRTIYKEVSGSDKPESWYPCQVVCDKCGKIATTVILTWNGQDVEYSCSSDVKYTKGCGHKGKKSPFGGNSTLPWKVEWAAKFAVVNVDLEGAGKDHYAAGGSRHVANRICEEVFGHKHPFDVRHEFILIEGAKMSTSAGVGATAAELEQLLPQHIFRFMMIQKEIMKTINFNPEGDTIPVLFDQYDEVCQGYFGESGLLDHKKRIFELAHYAERENFKNLNRFLPRFSLVAFYMQMPHVDIYKKFEDLKGDLLTDLDREELALRITCAKRWLEKCGPEKYIFKVQDTIPKLARTLSKEQKSFLKILANYIKEDEKVDGETLQLFIHDKKKELNMPSADIFKTIYISILGKDSGPKAGWLIEALDKKFLINRFEEVSQS